jgi:hypothetical protein
MSWFNLLGCVGGAVTGFIVGGPVGAAFGYFGGGLAFGVVEHTAARVVDGVNGGG